MTDTCASSTFTIAPLAPLASAPSGSSGGGGAGLGARLDVDWSVKKRDQEAKVRQERRSAVERARHSVEAGWVGGRPGQVTKAERLAAAKSKGTRDTGSPNERRAALSSVQKAMAAVAEVPSDTMISDEEFREVRARLRHLYPHASLSDMLKEAFQLEAMLMDAPHEAYDVLIAAYSRVKKMPDYVAGAEVNEKGVRASFRRARQDQQDATELKDWIARYGKRIPSILADLLQIDTDLRVNAAYHGAKLAVKFGAPAISAEIPAYEQRMAQRAQAKAHQQRFDNIHKGVNLAIQQGHIPGDVETLDEIAAILQLPKFQHSPNGLETLTRAFAISRHPDHVRLTGVKRTARSGPRDAGSLSIGGTGAVPDASAATRGNRNTRDAIRAAMEA